jgi:hypothetical protein
MSFWQFREYLTDGMPPRCPIIEWYGTLGGDIQAVFDLLVLELMETEDWSKTEPNPRKRKYKVLTEKHAGLCELRFKFEGKRKFRPLGIWRPDKCDFIFLGGCEKTGQDLTIPEGAFDSALKLKNAFDAGKGETREYLIQRNVG